MLRSDTAHLTGYCIRNCHNSICFDTPIPLSASIDWFGTEFDLEWMETLSAGDLLTFTSLDHEVPLSSYAHDQVYQVESFAQERV